MTEKRPTSLSNNFASKKSLKKIREEFHDHGEMDHEKFGPMLDTFVQFASKKLGIKSLPSMKLEKEPMSSSFGGYNPAEKSIVVISKNRHPMDIYRTVAHELVHHKQNEDGRLGKDIAKEGSTGSPIENEANSEAGKIMRWFAKANPNMFKSGYVTESYVTEGIQDTAKMKAVFLAGGPGSGKDFVMDRTLKGHGLREINSDNALEHLMRIRGLDPMMPKEEDYERNLARGTAKKLTKEKERLALANRHGVIVNGTADDPEYIAEVKKRLEELGYETKMLYVNTSNSVSRQRNFERGLAGGRKVPDGTDKQGRPDGSPDIRGEKWEAAQAAREPLRKLFGDEHFIPVDNSEDYRKVSKERKKEIDAQHDAIFKHYRQFTSKPSEAPQASEWISKEKQKRGIKKYTPARATTVSQRKPLRKPVARPVIPQEKYVPNASELEQAKRLGVQHVGGGQFGKGKEEVSHVSRNGQLTMVEETGSLSLKNWFDKSKSKDGKKGWVQVGGRHEGKPCARQPGQTSTPKCRSSSEAATMTKKEKQYAFKKKQREDPNQPSKSGASRPTMVKTYKNQEESLQMNDKTLQEIKDACYNKVKSRYKVWPSAYASGALVKCRKKGAANWGNKSKVDENFEEHITESKPSDREWGKSSLTKIYKEGTPGQTFPQNPLFEKKKKKLAQEDNNIPRIGLPVSGGLGPETTQYRPMIATGYGGAGTIPMAESIVNFVNNPKIQERYIEKYGNLAEMKLIQTANILNELDFTKSESRSFTKLRENWEALGGRDMGTVAKQGSKEEMQEGEDVIKPSSSIKGYKKNIHPMSTYEKKALAEAKPSFGAAFKAAREKGETEFSWGKGKFGTMKKGETADQYKSYIASKKAPAVDTVKSTVAPSVMQKPAEQPDKPVTPMATTPSRAKSVGGSTPGDAQPKRNDFSPNPQASTAERDPENKPLGGEMLSGTSETPRSIGLGSKTQTGKFQSTSKTGTQTPKEIDESEAWQRKEGKNPEGGLNKKGIASYRAANPGSKLSLAVTTEPSKLKPGSKSAKRRLSFCRRMKGMKSKLTSAKTARDPDSRINKSLRKWNCEE